MFVQDRSEGGIRLVTSASDLTAASACEFAFLRRVDVKFGRDVEVPPDDDPMLRRAAGLGDEHEQRVLQQYRDEFGEGTAGQPGGVVEIPNPARRTSASDLNTVAEQTLAAFAGGADVVFQATFFDPVQRAEVHATGDPEIGFIGFADFLQRMPDGAYEVQDTKLARRAKVSALMQLAAYAEQLERTRVPVAPEAVLILGDGARSRHRIADIAPVFRQRRARLHEILLDRARAIGDDGSRASARPIAWGAEGITACGRCEVCEPEIERTRDPMLIAGIRRTQRDALVGAGYNTIETVAGVNGEEAADLPGISPRVLERLSAQAELQLAAVTGEAPPVHVYDPAALAAIPQPNAGDLFFDFEGDPMYREPGEDGAARWGIDYLFGMVDLHEHFTALWAHTLEAEKQALVEFLKLVRERRAQHPAMKIYHYAPYERSHLLSLAARHGVGEAEVDQLLREHVFVDLYPIVRRALRVGSRSYSIKKLEPLYMGTELRDESGVTSAAQSVTEYAEAMAQLTAEDQEGGEENSAVRAEGQRRLDAIADYNRYDCVSTLRLRDWMLRLAAEHGIDPYPPNVLADAEGPGFESSGVAGVLATHAAMVQDPPGRKAAALAASAIDYHQREQKSFWWAHFARLIDPIEDWADTRDVIVIDEALSAVEADWFMPERARVQRRHVLLRGDLAPGSNLKAGADAFLLYEYPSPFPQPGAEPGSRGVRRVKIIERRDDGVIVEEFLGGIDSYHALPVALVPGAPPPAGAQKGAIEEWGAALARALDRGEFPGDPVVDLMRRTPPRLTGAENLAELAASIEDPIAAVTAALLRLDRSYLAVQGPPGTGKTYLAAHVIKALVEDHGWRIGVVAQSHRVVENVLDGVIRAGLAPDRVGKVPQGGKLVEGTPRPGYTVLPKNGHSLFLGGHARENQGCVLGGTAWDFANEARVQRGELELLVIDEAGQFSLAPTIAASVAAERLLLLGDPQQLPQVSQGSHPEPVDTSALGWLLDGHNTMPADLGVFLAETRRMRPELAAVVSELAYEDRLHAHPSTSQREVKGAGSAGLIWHPVAHRRNSTSSPEEAAEVVRLAQELLGGTVHEPGADPRKLCQHDLIVVAPYNAQVECVAAAFAEAGLAEVRVGTVDKFQGQEAAIAIVTLAASSAEEVPRGLEFLLMRNRLNVAISRAQWAAHLVSSDRLGDGLPGSSEGLAALSAYLRLTECGGGVPRG